MRPPTSDAITKQAIDLVLPELKGEAEEYENLWADLAEAATAKTLTEAMAMMADRDPRLVLEIHKRNPWTPSPDEATLLQAFGPNYMEAAMLTYEGEDPYGGSQFFTHVEKMCEELYERSVRELEANRPGAFDADALDLPEETSS